MAALAWKFKDYLDRHNVTPYRLQKALGGRVSHRLSYDWAKERPERLHLAVLERVMGALEDLTGEPVEIGDLLKVVPDPEPEVDAESALWLGTALTPVLEPWTWGPEGEPAGTPVRYVPGEGLYVYEDAPEDEHKDDQDGPA